jgi:hypothetical protein
MAEYLIQDTTLTEFADNIRSLGALTTSLAFSDMNAIVKNTIIYEDGIIDGSTEDVSNNRISNVRDYAFYKHPTLAEANFFAAVSIGNYSFYKCPTVASINVPSTTNIGMFAFRGCSSLISANYPLATTIGQGAFDECASLSSANLPLLEVVEPLTFRKCKALTTLDLPVVTSIGTQAFYDSGIASLTLRSNTVVTLENEDVFYFTPIEDGTGYVYVPSNLVDSYKSADGWSTYANQIRAIE